MKTSFIALLSLLLTSAALAQTATDEKEYMAVFFDGKKIGHCIHERSVSDRIVTTTETFKFTLNRLNTELNISQFESYKETIDGKPLSFSSKQNISNMQQEITGQVNNGTINLTINLGFGKQTQTIPWPKGALMPEGLKKVEKSKGLKPGTAYSVSMFSPSLMSEIKANLLVKGKKDVDLLGRVKQLWEVEMDLVMPTGTTKTINYVDADHKVYKTTMNMMGISMEIIACDKQFALSPNSIEDILSKTLLTSPRELGDLSQYKSLKYTLEPTSDQKFTINGSDNQTVSKAGDNLIVTVKPAKVRGKQAIHLKTADAKLTEYLTPNPYIQSDDKLVQKLTKRAIGNETNALKAARRIERFVQAYIQKKDLSIGYATAAEVAHSKQGDCSEHAVLTAAMCRTAGIPSRLALGIVYADNFLGNKSIFGGHAWTEAYIDGKWIGLDATRGENGFSVGHIKLATGNGKQADFFEMLNNLGFFKIAKIED